jgi:predicted chitinase
MNVATLVKICTVEGHRVTYSRVLNRLYFDKGYGGPSFKATTWMAALNQALVRAHCTTPSRVAMFMAQLGAESGSFRYTEELASGSEYNWRSDLGNIYAGDGQRYKGRTYIQITGRHNYGALSKWAHAHGYVPTATYFIDHPAMLADVKYIFLGPVWYWTVARNMNSYADGNDIVGATRAVNGGLNNLGGRKQRWILARKSGNALLPTGVSAAPPKHVTPAPKPTTPTKVATYTVRSGDTLSKIATKYHTTWQNLQKINNLANVNKIRVGQKLKVPVASKPVAAKPKPKVVMYTVRPGDTLGRIAAVHKTKGGYKTLQKLNNLSNPNKIFVGQKLRLN